MSPRLAPVTLGTSLGSSDEHGQLLYVGERLVAVLVCLSDDHEDLKGRWFIEAAFGLPTCDATFTTLNEVIEWVLRNRAQP